MITNSMIKKTLKENNLWHDTNNFFVARIEKLEKNGEDLYYLINKMYLVNQTEKEIILIPVFENEFLEIKEMIVYNYDEFEKIVLEKGDILSAHVSGKKGDSTIFSMVTDFHLNNKQINNFNAFIKFFAEKGMYENNSDRKYQPSERETILMKKASKQKTYRLIFFWLISLVSILTGKFYILPIGLVFLFFDTLIGSIIYSIKENKIKKENNNKE